MRATRDRRLGFTLCLALLTAGGCGDDNTNNKQPDLAVPGPFDLTPQQLCVPGTKECVGNDVARVCAPDGYTWSAVQCRVGEKCTDGDCVTDTAVCLKGTAYCIGNTAYRCP